MLNTIGDYDHIYIHQLIINEYNNASEIPLYHNHINNVPLEELSNFYKKIKIKKSDLQIPNYNIFDHANMVFMNSNSI